MEAFLLACLLVVLVVRWIYLRNRLDELENRLFGLESSVAAADRRAFAAPVAAPPTPVPPPMPPPPMPLPRPPAPTPPLTGAFHPLFQPVPAPARRTSEEWEALIGGNWVNKIGVFVAVIGIALLLNYAYTQLGAAGRVALSLGAELRV